MGIMVNLHVLDNSLEEISGVLSAQTNYAKGETEIVFKEGVVNAAAAKKAIEGLGYKVIE